jgi:hypothetical protein
VKYRFPSSRLVAEEWSKKVLNPMIQWSNDRHPNVSGWEISITIG